MNPAEFVGAMIGKPWVRWRSDFAACDCYGLVVLFYREVLGMDLGSVPQTDIATGFAGIEGWRECGTEAGATAFMAWANGAPTHCGIVLPGSMLLHAEGSQAHPGSVRVTRLAAVRRMYGDLKFYKYEKC